MKNLADKMKIFWYDTLDSTNSEASRRIEKFDNLSVIAAMCQTAGRGQRGNKWLTQSGENLTFSIILKFQEGDIPASRQMDITALTTVVLREFLRARGIHAVIKWPNDIYAGDRKLCGILIENSLTGEWISSSVIGIGLNVNQTAFDPSIVNPTSIRRLTGESYNVRDLLEQFCEAFSSRLPELGSDSLWEEYATGLYRQGEEHEFTDCATAETIRGTIKGVRRDGRLIFTLTGGESRYYSFKEINYII